MINFGKRFKGILSSNTPYQALRLRLALQEILLCIFESWPEAASWSRFAPATELAQINRALELVFNSHSFVSTDDAARACGLNRHRFSALFQSWMNIGFTDFSIRHRLYQAALQLIDTADPVKAIARRWGFTDASHLHRLFVKFYKCTPRMYRNAGKLHALPAIS